MIQLLGIRTYEEYGRIKKFVTLEKNNWRAKSVSYLLKNYQQFLSVIPKEEHYNLMFTLAEVEEGAGRKFISQDIYPFDIDGIDITRVDEYIETVLPILGVTREECTVLMTGHGLHIYIQGEHFEDVEQFKELRPIYKLLCDKCNAALAEKWLVGSLDTDMWSPARMGRLPETINRKDDKGLPDVEVKIIVNNITDTKFTLQSRVKLAEVNMHEQISPKALSRMPSPDTKGVTEGCMFLHHCKNNQDSINEPQWYAMLSVLSRLDGGVELCHEYSKEHPRYSEHDTTLKVEQAMFSSGPRTCENINSLWDGCKACPHFGNLRSPILIKGEDFIETESTGFRKISITKDGVATPKDISYDDLLAYYNRLHNHVTIAETGEVYTYNGTHWEVTSKLTLQAFVEDNVYPKPKGNERDEFVKKVQSNNLRSKTFLDCNGYMNLKNGVFELETKTLFPHSTEFGFRSIIPYDYNPSVTCPKFDKFMLEITEYDKECVDLLLEYVGYSLSNTPPENGEKALILYGEGANGKSVFIDVMRTLAGVGSTSAITMADLSNETQRYQLVGKLFNVAEETPRSSILESSSFKNLITGGIMTVKQLYHQPYSCKNTCKFIFACNDLPMTTDSSKGLLRRMLIVPFNASFLGNRADKNIRNNLYEELSGVLNRVIEGYDRLKANKWHFTMPKSVQDEEDEFANDSSPTASWYAEMVEVDKFGPLASGVTIPEMYKAYRNDVEEIYGTKSVLSLLDFKAQLRRYLKRVLKGTGADWAERIKQRTGKLRGITVKGLLERGNDEDF